MCECNLFRAGGRTDPYQPSLWRNYEPVALGAGHPSSQTHSCPAKARDWSQTGCDEKGHYTKVTASHFYYPDEKIGYGLMGMVP